MVGFVCLFSNLHRNSHFRFPFGTTGSISKRVHASESRRPGQSDMATLSLYGAACRWYSETWELGTPTGL